MEAQALNSTNEWSMNRGGGSNNKLNTLVIHEWAKIRTQQKIIIIIIICIYIGRFSFQVFTVGASECVAFAIAIDDATAAATAVVSLL